MNSLKHSFLQALKLLLFWILVFDFQRILFSIHHWESFNTVSWGDWFLTFVYSFRLDLATGAFLSILPLITLALCFVKPAKWTYRIFVVTMMTEVVLVSFIHSGEINAYTEWKHKLTSRVFMHLSNPDEMFRSADYSMTIWFFIYSILEVVFGWRMLRWLFKAQAPQTRLKIGYRVPVAIVGMSVFMIPFIILGRGGFQQIPINIDSAYFSNNHLANDLAVNSTYFFGNSYALYNKIDIAASLPKIDMDEANELVTQLYDYPREHDVRILDNKSPNIVMIIMESWSAEAIGCLSETKGATNHFDKLASEGVLFTNIYATGTRSEIGNSSIFGGMLAIPGLSISARPEKHRKLPTLNQDLATSGYSSHYIFSGDLKYGNIGGYFMDHGFDDVTDENGFPSNIERGKLNFYDEDLYRQLLIRINATQGKFMHCGFTGSTHSPFDQPKTKNQTWTGIEAPFMNSLIYADESLGKFIEQCKKEDWYENTLFIFVADHSHHTPKTQNMYDSDFYRIPLLLWGEPLKDEYKGVRIDKIGSQADIAATVMNQMNRDISKYPWSKDLLNPKCPEFALFTILTNGYGWITPKGRTTHAVELKQTLQNTFDSKSEKLEIKKCHALLNVLYEDYKSR